MSSEASVATENASGVDGDPTQLEGDANLPKSSMNASVDSVPQATQAGVSLHDHDILLEQKVQRDDPMHTLPQGDASSDPKKSSNKPDALPLPKLTDPWTTEIPMPDGDPFEYFLKPMLKKDTIQCDAWKDEVQNILIFAGLFSAVVTAFIIESYKQLRPDPNDSIVGLLAHIAEKLDNASINGTASISSIVSDTTFAPSRSDININIFWFISLVLSLTAALIGIITLQWLREHQRYDNALKPSETMAILHMRLDSLKRWYVPQIFAGLPLLLQGALVLFFAGLIEFLFALRLEVAVPVTLAACVPLIFLTATTILPFLQVCILQDPFRLSINNDVPSPCPYKSPQSLIARRIGTASQTMFTCFTFMVTGAHSCVISIFWFFRTLSWHRLILRLARRPPPSADRPSQEPIFRTQKTNLKARLRDPYPQKICEIRDASGDWTSIDSSWMDTRTTYAVSLCLAYRDVNDLVDPRPDSSLSLNPEVYDCTRCLYDIGRSSRVDADNSALYGCIEALCSQEMDRFTKYGYYTYRDFILRSSDLHSAFGCLLRYGQAMDDPPITAAFFKDVILHGDNRNWETTVKTLYVAFLASWAGATYFPFGSAICNRVDEVTGRFVVNRLKISPERLFPLPASTSESYYHIGDVIIGENPSQSITDLFLAFLDSCSAMKSNGQTVLRPAPALENYGAVSAYMRIIVCTQHWNATRDAVWQLTRRLSITPNLIQEKPFLMIAACFYLNALVKRGIHERLDESFPPLLQLILQACRITNDKCDKYYGWRGLDDAIDAIYHHHNSPQITQLSAPQTDQPYRTISLASS